MANIGTVEGTIRLNDQFTSVLGRAASQLEKHGQKMQQLGQQMSNAGAKMSTAITLPIAAVGGLAVKSFADFDAAMNQSLAIMGDVSEELRVEMAGAARQMAKETTFSAKQAAESYFFLASAGLDAKSSIMALPTVAKFAQAGMFDMALATDLLTDAQSALGLTIRDDAVKNMENMVRVSDVLVRANTLANATVQQFSEALTNEAGAALKSFRIDVEEGVAVLAAFADQGVKGNVAGTGLSRILRLMTSAAISNADAYKRLKVEVFDTEGNIRNLADIIADLENALGHLSDEQRTAALEALGFQARVQGVILPLLGTSEAIRGYEKAHRDAAGFTEQVASKQLLSFSNQLKLLKNRITDAAITLGQAMIPSIIGFVQSAVVPAIAAVAKIAKAFAELPPPVRTVIMAFFAIVAAIGPVLFIAGQLVSAWGALAVAIPGLTGVIGGLLATILGPAGWIAAGVALLLAWKPARDFLLDLGRTVISTLVTWFQAAKAAALAFWESTAEGRRVLGEVAGFVWELVTVAVELHRTITSGVISAFASLYGWLRDISSGALAPLVSGVQSAIGWFRDVAAATVEWWGSTREAREMLVAFARVIAQDILGALQRFGALVIDHIQRQLQLAGMVWKVISALLELSGILPALRRHVEFVTTGFKLFWEWLKEAKTALDEWAASVGGYARIVAAMIPGGNAALDQIQQWAKRAEVSVAWNKALAGSTLEVGESSEEATAWIEAMDAASAGVLKEIEKLNAEESKRTNTLGQMSEALEEAIKATVETTKVNRALLAALSDSEQKYEILNALLQAGIPLADALTGKYDAMAKALIASSKALEFELALREEEKRLATEILDLYEKIGQARESASFGKIEVPELEMAWPLPTAEDWEEMNTAYRASAGKMAADLEALQKRAWENVQDIASSAIAEILKTGKVSWKSLGESLLDVFAQMLAKMLVTWMANLATRLRAELAAAATARAAWSSVGATGGGGGGGGWLGSIAKLFGIGGGGGMAVTGTQSVYGVAMPTYGAGGAGAGGGLGGVSWASLGVMFGTAAAAIMVAELGNAWVAGKKLKNTAGTLTMGGDQLFSGEAFASGKAGQLNEQMVAAYKHLKATFEQVAALTGSVLQSLPQITVNVKGTGDIWVTVGSLMAKKFKDMNEALSYALAEGIKQAEFTGLSAQVEAALKNTTATTFEELQAELAIALRSEELVTGQVGKSEIRNAVNEWFAFIQEELRLGIVQATGASGGLKGLVSFFVDAFKEFKGIEKDPSEAIRGRAEALRAELAITVANLQVMKADLLAKQAVAVATGGGAQASAAYAKILSESALVALGAGKATSAYTETIIAQAQAAAAAAEANVAALAAIDEALAILANLAISELDIQAAIDRAQRASQGGKGGSRKAEMEQLRDLLDQMSFDRLVAGMTELEAGLARLAREYDQNLAKAHGNADLVAQLTEEYRLQAEQLLRNVQLAAVDVFQDFMGIGASPFAQLKEQWENARKAVEEAGFGADRASQMLARLNRHYAEQVKLLSRQQFVSIGDGLLGILERYYGGVEGFEKFRMKLEQIRFELEYANLRLQFETLKKNGALGERMLRRMGKVFAFIDANPIDWGAFIAPSVPDAGGGGGGGAAGDAARELADALNRLKDIYARQLSPFEQAIRGVVDEFADLRRILGWTTELQTLYALELRRVIAEQVSAIQRMRDELSFRADSPERSIDQFRRAQEQANAAIAAMAGGDFSQIDKIPDLVARVLELNPRAQASEGSRFLFAWADQILAQTQAAAEEFALGIDPGGANDPFAWLRHIPTAGDDAVVAAVDRVAFRQDVQTAEEKAEAAREAEREKKRIERAAAKEERERARKEARIEKIIQKQVNQIEVLKDIRHELRQGAKLAKVS